MKQLKYRVEELHRGDWQPLEAKDEKGNKLGQRTVFITEEEAATMNIDANAQRIKYVLDDKPNATGGTETPMAKAKRLKAEIAVAETVEAVEALAEGGTPAVLKAAEERKAELNK